MKWILLSAALSFCLFVGSAAAQSTLRVLTIKALDGRNGKPIRGAHLLVFAGGTAEELRQKAHNFDLQTDKNGDAKLTLNPVLLKFMQVWVDGETLCESGPNHVSFRIEQVIVKGLLAPNLCGDLRKPVEPGELLIFARPATFAEKMRW